MPASTSVFSEDVPDFSFFMVFSTYIVPFCLDLCLFTPNFGFGLLQQIAENSSDLFLYYVVDPDWKSSHSATFPFSTISISPACSPYGLVNLSAFVTHSGSVMNTSERQPLWQRNLNSSDHASQTLCS